MLTSELHDLKLSRCCRVKVCNWLAIFACGLFFSTTLYTEINSDPLNGKNARYVMVLVMKLNFDVSKMLAVKAERLSIICSRSPWKVKLPYFLEFFNLIHSIGMNNHEVIWKHLHGQIIRNFLDYLLFYVTTKPYVCSGYHEIVKNLCTVQSEYFLNLCHLFQKYCNIKPYFEMKYRNQYMLMWISV